MMDLVVLVADKDTSEALNSLLCRHQLLGIRRIQWTLLRSPEHDPGVLRQASELLRMFLQTHRFALVLLDRAGCGRDEMPRVRIEEEIEASLRRNGWRDRCAAVVIDPELECWVWTDTAETAAALGWEGRLEGLRSWLHEARLLGRGRTKPIDPKEAMHAALRKSNTPRSSAIFAQLAARIDPTTCTDAAYLKMACTLREWFGR